MKSEKNLEPDHDMMGKDALMAIFRETDSSLVQELALRLIRTEKELLALRKAKEPITLNGDEKDYPIDWYAGAATRDMVVAFLEGKGLEVSDGN